MILIRTALAFAIAAVLSAADPFLGVWRLSHSKSSGALPEDEIVTIRERGGRLAVEVKVVNGPNHENVVIRYTAPERGGAGKIESGPYDAVAVKREGSSSMEITYFATGSEARSTRVVVAKDGKTMSSIGKVRVGSEAWNIVFEKQADSGGRTGSR